MMSDPALGLLMLGLIVVVIMMGFPTAFTLMGLGMFFGFVAFYDPPQHWIDNRIFDLMVQRTYGAMTNDVLISIPLFVLMGYVMERGALVDKMFYSIQLAFRRVPASLAVATLIVCTFWGIASGLVGAVVVLMGVIAFNPMLQAGYDVRLASGVITAGGTLGILIPPSVMIIVYAAVAGQSVVKLYAAAMFPGFFLAVPLPRLHHRLGDDQPEDRAAAAGGADASAGAGLDAPVPVAPTRRNMLVGLCQGPALAAAGAGRSRPSRAARPTGAARQNFADRAGAARRLTAARCARVVVRRHPSAGGGRSEAVPASQQLGTPDLGTEAAARRRGRARRTASTSWFWRHRRRLRGVPDGPLLLRAWTPSASRS